MNNNNEQKINANEIDNCKKEITRLRDQIEQLRDTQCNTSLKEHTTKEKLARTPRLAFQVVKQFKGHNGKIYDSDWSTDCTLLLSASQDGHLMIWNPMTTRKRITYILKSTWVMTCAFAPSAKIIACGGLDNLCSIYDVNFDPKYVINDGPPLRQLQHHEGYISAVEFLTDKQIISASGDSTCVLWDIERKIPLTTFLDHTGDVTSLAVNSKLHNNNNNREQIFLSGSVDATVKVWDIRKKLCCGEFEGHDADVNSVCWYPDEFGFASGSDDATLRLFDMRAYKQLNEYRDDDIVAGATAVSFSLSGNLLFAGYDDEPFAVGWDVRHAEKTCKLNHSQRVSTLQVSPNGHAICTSSWDRMLRLWIGKR